MENIPKLSLSWPNSPNMGFRNFEVKDWDTGQIFLFATLHALWQFHQDPIYLNADKDNMKEKSFP